MSALMRRNALANSTVMSRSLQDASTFTRSAVGPIGNAALRSIAVMLDQLAHTLGGGGKAPALDEVRLHLSAAVELTRTAEGLELQAATRAANLLRQVADEMTCMATVARTEVAS